MIKSFKLFESTNEIDFVKEIFQELEYDYKVGVSVFKAAIFNDRYCVSVWVSNTDEQNLNLIESFNSLVSKCEEMLDLKVSNRGNSNYGSGGKFIKLLKDSNPFPNDTIYMVTSDIDKINSFISKGYGIKELRVYLV